MRRRCWLAIGLLVLLQPALVMAQSDGLVTEPSRFSVRMTLDRFATAVRAAGWVVFTEIDHAEAARQVGLTLAPRVVLVFGNPRGGTAAMAAHPTLAIDLPMRVLVWADDAGKVFVTRSSGADIARRVYARHEMAIDDAGQQGIDRMIGGLVRLATE